MQKSALILFTCLAFAVALTIQDPNKSNKVLLAREQSDEQIESLKPIWEIIIRSPSQMHKLKSCDVVTCFAKCFQNHAFGGICENDSCKCYTIVP